MSQVVRDTVLVLCLAALPAIGQEAPFQKLYTGDEATGDQVLFLYQFLPGQSAKDNSGHGHDLTLRDQAGYVADGPLTGAGALESFATVAGAEKPGGAMAKSSARLTPAGAFTLEVWLKPKAEMAQTPLAMLVDKKYFNYTKDLPEANNDYCLFVRKIKEGKQQVVAYLGYGQDSAFYTSDPVAFETGVWRHVAFTYNGTGVGRFFLDGKPIGRTVQSGRGPVVAGKHPLVLGDRVGSSYQGFPGFLGQVRMVNGIAAAFQGAVEMAALEGRRVFERFEAAAGLRLLVSSDLSEPVREVVISAEVATGPREVARLPELAAGGQATVAVPLETALRPGDYSVVARLAGRSDRGPVKVEATVPVTIVARQPERMPVVLWGADTNLDRVAPIGFTHQVVTHAWYEKIWELGAEAPAETPAGLAAKTALLDEHLRRGLRGVGYVYEPHYLEGKPELLARFGRVTRDGQRTDRPSLCASFPELETFCRNTGRAVTRAFGSHPAFDGCLVHSEQRDGTEVCFHEHDKAAYRQATGQSIPDAVASKYGVRYTSLKGFPAHRVVPDDDAILTYYRWFWKQGDGWNKLHTATHEGLKDGARPGFWDWYDPVTRVPAVWGSGGAVDVVSTWTYSYPGPLKLGQTCDEVLAMAEGTGQRVMKMTQIIWYRSGTAPKLPEREADRADWEKEQPDAPFITIAPDHLREALWCELARPVEGVMYHGWGSLVPEAKPGAYRCTNLKTKDALAELVRDVVRPLGPMLRHVPDAPMDVAILESFASQVFAGRGSWGWGDSWEADCHVVCQYAQLQPKILFDEHVLRDGLDRYQVLVMPYCDVLTRAVAERVKAFQNRGGIVVGDRDLCPAIVPDILLTAHKRTGKADEDKAALLQLAAGLRAELDAVYQRYAETDQPDVVCRRRRAGQADYLFVINDRRQFGKYVGHHRKVMEDGVPVTATVRCRRPGAVVYDVLARKLVPTTAEPGGSAWKTALGPGEGRLYVLLDQPVAAVTVTAPGAARGAAIELRAAVNGPDGRPLKAVVPLEVEIVDPQGRPAEFTGYHAAPDGQWSQRIVPAANDLPGRWTVKVTELLSGRVGQATFTVT